MNILRTRNVLAAAASGIVLAGALSFAPAGASTTATITLSTTGGITISEPAGTPAAPKGLGSTASTTGAWTTGGLGAVTVTDGRTGLLVNSWIASVTVTDFALANPPVSATAAQKTIPATGMVYNMGTVTHGSENPAGATFAATGTAVVANTALAVGTMSALGANSESWNPTLTVALTNQLAGTYTGTVTHSAA